MDGNWKSYLCNVNGKIASILVDLSLQERAPDPSREWLLYVWVHFNNPRPDGLSDRNEAPTLFDISDALTNALRGTCDAVPWGTITTDGRREFYYYGHQCEGFNFAVEEAMQKFEGYKIDVGTESDPQWHQYQNVLYPSDEELQRIKNHEVVEVLEKRGDVLSPPQPVRHWLYFDSAEQRAQFKEAAMRLHYHVGSQIETPGEQQPFGIVMERSQPVDPESIDEAVIELFRLGRQLGGMYDGWETEIVRIH